MTKVIDYYVSLSSPWAYLGGPRLAAMARRHGAVVAVKPVEFGRVLLAGGGVPLPQRSAARRAYRLAELRRWRDFLGLPLNLEPACFPVPGGMAACTMIAAGRAGGDDLRLAQALLAAVWVEERNIADFATLAAIVEACGMYAPHVLAAACAPETRFALAANTDEALARGVFGVPAYRYRGELFWGQDRLDFLDRALAA